MSDSYEELVKLWQEYNLRLEDEEYCGLRVAPDPDNEYTRELKKELPELPDHLGAIDSAIEWWRKHGEGLQRRPRMERLHHLLRRLDQALVDLHPPPTVVTEAGRLLLGERWWSAYRSEKAAETGEEMSRTGWVRDTTPLLRICVLKEAGARWLDSERLRERIWNMLGVGRREEGVPHAPVLRIGLCVLGRHEKTQFEATGVLDEANRIHGFRAMGVVWDSGSQGSVEAALQACVAWAHESRIHVLCFPELALDEDGRNALRREIERDPGSLCLILPGSFHERDPEPKRTIGWVNRARIWAVHAGATPEVVELGGFEKTEPFTMSPEHVGDAIHNHDPDSGCLGYREHIDPGDQLTIVPTPVGRFGIAICRDSFRSNLMSRYAPVVDHLVVISMNEARTDWFWFTSEELAKSSFAGLVLCELDPVRRRSRHHR